MVSGVPNRAPAFEIRPIPERILIRLDHDLVGAVDALDPWRTIAERRIDASLLQIGRFEHVRARREDQGSIGIFFLSLLIAGSTFGNRPIAVKVSASSDPFPAAIKVGLSPPGQSLVVVRKAGTGAKALAEAERRRFCRRHRPIAVPSAYRQPEQGRASRGQPDRILRSLRCMVSDSASARPHAPGPGWASGAETGDRPPQNRRICLLSRLHDRTDSPSRAGARAGDSCLITRRAARTIGNSRNSRFGQNNSRLGRQKFPVICLEFCGT